MPKSIKVDKATLEHMKHVVADAQKTSKEFDEKIQELKRRQDALKERRRKNRLGAY